MFKRITAALIASIALIASAQAQTIDLLYKSSDNKHVASLANARSFTGVVGKVNIQAAGNTAAASLADGTGSVYAAMIVDPKVLAIYTQVGATTRWVNVTQIADAYCSNNASQIIWQAPYQYAGESLGGDNCAVFYAWLNRAN